MHFPLPLTLLGTSIVLVKALHTFFPILDIVPAPFRPLGIVVIVIGLILIIWTALLFQNAQTDIRPRGQPTTFIIDGPFRISRNPMYLGMILIILGLSIFFGTLSTFFPPLIFAYILHQYLIPYEETILAKTFGEKYEKYKASVRKWV